MSTFPPTSEQANCVEQFKTGKKLRINAYAGTGKTSTLELISEATNRRGTYVCFNKSIATEAAKRFSPTVQCSTMHAMAFRSMMRRYSVDKMTKSINAGYLAQRMRYRERDVAPNFTVTSRGWAFLVLECIRHWQRSGRPQMTERDVIYKGKLETLDESIRNRLAWEVLKDALDLWDMMADPKSDIPLGHDGYLKLWALSEPVLPGDFILLDEAQDTNGVVLELMRRQPAQVVCVGDRHQQIYEWRGAMNAMTLLPADVEARLSTSFRFGTAVANYATRILGILGETVPLKGNPDRSSSVGPVEKADAILARTNVRLIEEVFTLIRQGKQPCVVGGVDDLVSFLNGAESLMAGRPVATPLELFGFANWDEVKQTCHREGESAADLRRWVKLIEDYGLENLRRTLQRLPNNEAAADIVLSTGHKSKGREWPAVRLCDDFLRGVRTEKEEKNKTALDVAPLQDGARDHSQELRLYYVAATRARERLDVHPSLEEKLVKAAKDMGVDLEDAA